MIDLRFTIFDYLILERRALSIFNLFYKNNIDLKIAKGLYINLKSKIQNPKLAGSVKDRKVRVKNIFL